LSVPCRVTIIHTVADYDRWAEVVLGTRGWLPGIERVTVHRSVDDGNEVMVELEVESAEVAREVLQSAALRDLLDRSGLEFYPPVFIGEQVAELSAPDR
jgi:hypothetical protein